MEQSILGKRVLFSNNGNMTEEAIEKCIVEQSEESRKEDREGFTFLASANKKLAIPVFQSCKYQRPLGASASLEVGMVA